MPTLATPKGWFPARYPGYCACGGRFEAGDPIKAYQGLDVPDALWLAACCGRSRTTDERTSS